MGFSDASIKIVKYHRNLLHKKSYFKDRDVSQFSSNLAKATRKKFSKEALQRIKKRHRQNTLKSLFFLTTLVMLTLFLVWALLL